MRLGQLPADFTEIACAGETYISNGTDEDGHWETIATCDGGKPGDCGFHFVLEDEGEPCWSITTTTFSLIHGQHITHSWERAKAQEKQR